MGSGVAAGWTVSLASSGSSGQRRSARRSASMGETLQRGLEDAERTRAEQLIEEVWAGAVVGSSLTSVPCCAALPLLAVEVWSERGAGPLACALS